MKNSDVKNWNNNDSNSRNNNSNNSLTPRPCCKSVKGIEIAYKQFASIHTSVQDQSANH